MNCSKTRHLVLSFATILASLAFAVTAFAETPAVSPEKKAADPGDLIKKRVADAMEAIRKAQEKRENLLYKELWQRFPHQANWLAQDSCDRQQARMNPRYDFKADVLKVFRADQAYYEKIIGRVLKDLGDQGKGFEKTFESLKKSNANPTDARWLDLYLQACKARRKSFLKPLLAKTKQIVFAKHQVFGSRSGILYITETEGSPAESELSVIDLAPEAKGELATVSTLVDSKTA